MITMSIGGLAVLGLFIWYAIEEDANWSWGPIATGFFGLYYAAIGLLAGVLLALALGVSAGLTHHTHCYALPSQELHNLSDSKDVNGSFFLGSGYVNTTLMYYYYSKQGDGSYRVHSVVATTSDVFEDNPVQPYMVPFAVAVDWPMSLFTLSEGGWTCGADFHIPRGSINDSYKVG